MRFRFLILVTCLGLAETAAAQVETIVKSIGDLESVRDPKCYATASRLEDFIYGTPLDVSARVEKIGLQKRLILPIWKQASTDDPSGPISAAALAPLLQAAVPAKETSDGSWNVSLPAGGTIRISARDLRQYGSVAYALRAILAVQQDALLQNIRLTPLDPAAIDSFKKWLDLVTLAALQDADAASRQAGRRDMDAATLRRSWQRVTGPAPAVPAPTATAAAAARPEAERFATIRAVVAKKLQAFEAYNSLSMPVFLRNLQVYMARHMWPSDAEEGKAFKDAFTEIMVAWTSDVLLESDKRARKARHPFIRVEDVHAALQLYEPHELNQYEDCIYFPLLPKGERVVIEAYDLDSFRDPGIHWLYLSEVLNDPDYKGSLEPDPFAAELLTEGVAQFGVLVLRIAGQIAEKEEVERLSPKHLTSALQDIQRRLDKHASMPAPRPGRSAIASATRLPPPAGSKYFTDVSAASGIDFEHRMSDWLSRFIRSYTVSEGNTVRLAVPPTFGGGGVAAEDIDEDGDIDVLILSGTGNALYLNDGKGRFADVAAKAGLAWRRPDGRGGEPRQPIIADFDNDGRQDILVTYVDDDHRIYRNLGDAKFEDLTAKAGLGGKGLVGGPATALDFDRDGLLDLYVGYFGDYIRGELPTLSRRNTNALPDRLFRNRGNFVFEDVTAGSGVANPGWAQSVGHLDFDGDGWEDLICGNDFGVNAWYRNLGNGRFQDVSASLGTDKPSYTMNVGITDLNRDGFPDVYISNIVTMDKDEKYVLPDPKTRMKFNPQKMANMRVVEANDLFVSSAAGGKLSRYDQSTAVGRGYRSTGWAWDADFFDFDLDGDDDLYVANGMNEYAVYSSVNPYLTDPKGVPTNAIMPVAEKEMNVFFVNRGGRLVEESEKSGTNLLGNSRSVAYLDMDADGDLDMILNNFNSPAHVYRNDAGGNGNHWLKVRLVGDPQKGVSRDAIGAQLIVDTKNNRNLWREVFSTIGYLSVHPKEQHFGLGADTQATVTVVWPGGAREVYRDLAVDRSYRIEQGRGLVP